MQNVFSQLDLIVKEIAVQNVSKISVILSPLFSSFVKGENILLHFVQGVIISVRDIRKTKNYITLKNYFDLTLVPLVKFH